MPTQAARPPAHPQRAIRPWLLLAATGLALAATLLSWWAYENIPGVHYRVRVVWAQAYDIFMPQAELLPTPVSAQALRAPTAIPSSPTPTAPPATVASASATPRSAPSATPLPPTATTIPDAFLLKGIRHEKQYFNNCGPTTLAMDLSYWDWQGDQHDIARDLRPNQDDKNVSPYEIQAYLLAHGFDAIVRVNGDLEILRRFIAAGYPVLVEKGLTCQEGEDRCTGWVGHYSLVVGYEHPYKRFTLEDSFRGSGIKTTYQELLAEWRAFNYVYIVPFPVGEARRAQVLALVGAAADVERNYRDALARSETEAADSKWSPAAFAWFNAGTNLAALGDNVGAAAAYDQARSIGLPSAMLWYQFGLYQAYYAVGRYEELEHLASVAIAKAHLSGVEEAYYWRGRARQALGFDDQAHADYRAALDANPTFQLARDALMPPTVVP